MSGSSSADAAAEAADGPAAFRPAVVAAVRERLQALDGVDDASFSGPPIDGLPLQPLEVGDLQPELWSGGGHSEARARFVRELKLGCEKAGIAPVLSDEAAARIFAAIPDRGVELAARCLGMLAGEPGEAVRIEIRRVLGRSDAVRQTTPAAVALAREAGPAVFAGVR